MDREKLLDAAVDLIEAAEGLHDDIGKTKYLGLDVKIIAMQNMMSLETVRRLNPDHYETAEKLFDVFKKSNLEADKILRDH